jgi:hypothetical protein
VVIKVRDLRKVSAALETEEGVVVGEAVSIEAILGGLEGEGANAILLHTAAIFKMEEQARESYPACWTEPAFVDWETQRVAGVLLCCFCRVKHAGWLKVWMVEVVVDSRSESIY